MKNIAIIFGGDSLEHTISLKNAYKVSEELEIHKEYNFIYIGIMKNGVWKYSFDFEKIINIKDQLNPTIITSCSDVFQIGNGKINNIKIDKAFLTTHGKNGEDGCIQGYLKMNAIPFSGCDIDGSVICFNKDVSKSIAKHNNINIVPYITVKKGYILEEVVNQLKKIGDKFIVKINKGGSSIGVFQAEFNNIEEILNKALEMDDVVLVERELITREISVFCLSDGNNIEFSDLFEYKKDNNLFSYEEKYLKKSDNDNSQSTIDISDEIKNRIHQYSSILFNKLYLKEYGRIDFFLDEENILYFNEINTLPGLTLSFTKMWIKKYTFYEILKKLIEL